jgi:hypothetical protein
MTEIGAMRIGNASAGLVAAFFARVRTRKLDDQYKP